MSKILNVFLMFILTIGFIQAEDYKKILITVNHSGSADQNVLSSFGRNYRPSGKYSTELNVRRQINTIARDYHLLVNDNAWSINSLGVYCAVLAVPGKIQIDDLLIQLRKDKRVESVQSMFEYAIKTDEVLQKKLIAAQPVTGVYNDPYFTLQFESKKNIVHELHQTATGNGIKLAVIDTGADTSHDELSRQINKTHNFVDDNDRQFDQDIHGTAVSGIIAAEPNNALGIVGLAPDVDLRVMKACWQSGQGGGAHCNSFTLANALSVGIDDEVDIFNISLSGPRDPLIERLIKVAVNQGIIIVAADPVNSQQRYPALLPGVINVRQAMNKNEEANQQQLITPPQKDLIFYVNGIEILTTAPNNSFDFFSGSSMSTAIVSSLCAVLLERDGDLDIAKLHDIIEQAL